MNRRQRALLLFAIWAAVILVFFSFSTRQEYYTIPALPALALLIGGWLQQEDDSAHDSSLRRSGRIGSVVLLVDRAGAYRRDISAGAQQERSAPIATWPTC